MRDDRGLCEHACFCANTLTNVWKLAKQESLDPAARAQVVAMVEHCPSGALTYSLPGAQGDVEPDLAAAVAVVDDGPLWVTGPVPVERSDGQALETRNRMVLCRCGYSKNKPLRRLARRRRIRRLRGQLTLRTPPAQVPARACPR